MELQLQFKLLIIVGDSVKRETTIRCAFVFLRSVCEFTIQFDDLEDFLDTFMLCYGELKDLLGKCALCFSDSKALLSSVT